MNKSDYQINVAGENALIIYFNAPDSTELTPETSVRVQSATQILSESYAQHIVELVPSYASLLVVFDPIALDHYQMRKFIRQALSQVSDEASEQGRVIELPVYYGEEVGPDLARIAERSNLSIDEVIDLHCGDTYQVFTIGFAPGFAYLGQVNETIATPRLSTPRAKVPAGAVAIADRQTAIYPAESPGGWNIIGRCPTPMFSPDKSPVMPVAVGDKVKFIAISREEYLAMGGQL